MDLTGIASATKLEPPTFDTFTAQVVRADESGLWVVPIGDDPAHPVGPCRGGWTSSGTRMPPGALVALVMTPDGPWAVGIDNPALAVNDATFAPFQNPSFELLYPGGVPVGSSPVPGWSAFWGYGQNYDGADPVPSGNYRLTVVEGVAVHGLRCIQVEAHGTRAVLNTTEWSVQPGSSVEVSIYARGEGSAPRLDLQLWSNVAGSTPGPFSPGVYFAGATWLLENDWLRYRTTVTIPPTHSRLSLYVYPQSDDAGVSTVWIDNADADLVEIDPAAAHQDIMRRAALVLTGGGARTVTAGGNVAWPQPFTIAGVGRDPDEAADGRWSIAMPPNGTVIPVHQSAARVSHTVAGGVVALNADDALWYELPIGEPAASQPGRFHIIGSTSTDAFTVPPHWILVVRRTTWDSSNRGPEYRWGDGRAHDPWRTPSLNAGWIEGTVVPRFRKVDGGSSVQCRGRVRNGAGSAFTFPDGYWPVDTHTVVVRDGAGAAGILTITPAGVLTTSGNNTDHSIDTTFAVD